MSINTKIRYSALCAGILLGLRAISYLGIFVFFIFAQGEQFAGQQSGSMGFVQGGYALLTILIDLSLSLFFLFVFAKWSNSKREQSLHHTD